MALDSGLIKEQNDSHAASKDAEVVRHDGPQRQDTRRAKPKKGPLVIDTGVGIQEGWYLRARPATPRSDQFSVQPSAPLGEIFTKGAPHESTTTSASDGANSSTSNLGRGRPESNVQDVEASSNDVSVGLGNWIRIVSGLYGVAQERGDSHAASKYAQVDVRYGVPQQQDTGRPKPAKGPLVVDTGIGIQESWYLRARSEGVNSVESTQSMCRRHGGRVRSVDLPRRVGGAAHRGHTSAPPLRKASGAEEGWPHTRRYETDRGTPSRENIFARVSSESDVHAFGASSDDDSIGLVNWTRIVSRLCGVAQEAQSLVASERCAAETPIFEANLVMPKLPNAQCQLPKHPFIKTGLAAEETGAVDVSAICMEFQSDEQSAAAAPGEGASIASETYSSGANAQIIGRQADTVGIGSAPANFLGPDRDTSCKTTAVAEGVRTGQGPIAPAAEGLHFVLNDAAPIWSSVLRSKNGRCPVLRLEDAQPIFSLPQPSAELSAPSMGIKHSDIGNDHNEDAEIMQMSQVEHESKKDLRSCWGRADEAPDLTQEAVDFEEEFDTAMNDLRNRLDSMLQRRLARMLQERLDVNQMPSLAAPPCNLEPQPPKVTNHAKNFVEEASFVYPAFKPEVASTDGLDMMYDVEAHGMRQSKNRSNPSAFMSQNTKRPRATEGLSDSERERKSKRLPQWRIDVESLKELLDEPDDSKLVLFVKTNIFEALATIMLFTNITVLGIQVELQGNDFGQDDTPAFCALNTICCLTFLIEVILRIYAHGWLKYFFSRDRFWSWLDVVVVTMQIIETAISCASQLSSSTPSFIWGLVRAARVCRVVRAIRVMRFLRGFKVLIDAILATLKRCIWALLLSAIILLVFAIIFAEVASDFLAAHLHDFDEYAMLNYYFGNLSKSIFTLVKAITGGIEWEICANELSNVGDLFVVLFVAYVAFMQFVLINVIVGLFLQSAVEQAQHDRDHIFQLRLQQKHQYVEKLKLLLDASPDGRISLSEFEKNLKCEEVQAFWECLEIQHVDAWTIFKLLDIDGGGAVDCGEFVEGCIQLRGNSRNIDVVQSMYYNRWIIDKVCEVADYFDNLQMSTIVLNPPVQKSVVEGNS